MHAIIVLPCFVARKIAVCVVVIKINVKVLGSFGWSWLLYTADLSITLKACWPFANEKDLTHIAWYPSNETQ